MHNGLCRFAIRSVCKSIQTKRCTISSRPNSSQRRRNGQHIKRTKKRPRASVRNKWEGAQLPWEAFRAYPKKCEAQKPPKACSCLQYLWNTSRQHSWNLTCPRWLQVPEKKVGALAASLTSEHTKPSKVPPSLVTLHQCLSRLPNSVVYLQKKKTILGH